MATVGELDSSLAAQCLDFCKALTSQGKAFQFSLNIGSAFSFTLDTSCKDSLTKKRASLFILRRSAKHVEEFAPDQELTSQSSTFQCGHCEKVFKQEEFCILFTSSIRCCTWWMLLSWRGAFGWCTLYTQCTWCHTWSQVYGELEGVVDKLAKEAQRGTLPRFKAVITRFLFSQLN